MGATAPRRTRGSADALDLLLGTRLRRFRPRLTVESFMIAVFAAVIVFSLGALVLSLLA